MDLGASGRRPMRELSGDGALASVSVVPFASGNCTRSGRVDGRPNESGRSTRGSSPASRQSFRVSGRRTGHPRAAGVDALRLESRDQAAEIGQRGGLAQRLQVTRRVIGRGERQLGEVGSQSPRARCKPARYAPAASPIAKARFQSSRLHWQLLIRIPRISRAALAPVLQLEPGLAPRG